MCVKTPHQLPSNSRHAGCHLKSTPASTTYLWVEEVRVDSGLISSGPIIRLIKGVINRVTIRSVLLRLAARRQVRSTASLTLSISRQLTPAPLCPSQESRACQTRTCQAPSPPSAAVGPRPRRDAGQAGSACTRLALAEDSAPASRWRMKVETTRVGAFTSHW